MGDGYVYLYHEKQVAGLCAVHALNTLFQEPLFSPVDLMHIAQDFDAKEREQMMQAGVDSTDFLKYMAEDSGNVADDGNYSVQVIEVALQVWNLTCLPITSPDMKESKANPLIEDAFICNLASHWLTIRKIEGDWYNFNSMLDEPQFLSTFYLSAFLDTLLEKGWDIFVVRGDLPKYNPLKYSAANKNWHKMRRKGAQGSKTTAPSSYEDDLQAAINASLGGGDDSELAAAIAMSVESNTPPQAATEQAEPMDEDLALAIQMSLSGAASTTTSTTTPAIEEPPEPGSDVDSSLITSLVIRMPDGSRLTRKFLRKDPLKNVHDFVTVKGNGIKGFRLATTFPSKRFEDMTQTLEQLGLVPDASMVVIVD